MARLDVHDVNDEPQGVAEAFREIIAGARVPRATYRVQMNREFTFEDARAIVPYLDALGVSDLYASPFFKARPGSMHGYDLTDHNALNPEIGTRDAFDALSRSLAGRGMGLLLDFVPNHMGVGTSDNAWWMDVLENGPSSLYAPFFDVDWAPLKAELARKVLLPILGDHYGRVLEDGHIEVTFDGGAFFLRVYGNPLPVNPRTYPRILEPLLPGLSTALGEEHDAVLELQSIITGLGHLPPRWETHRPKVIERRREKEILKRRLHDLVASQPEVARAIEAQLALVKGTKGDPSSFDRLEGILEEQAYRISYWRVAAEEINYRRFFDINELAAIRMENPIVFAEAHRLLFSLLAEGKVTGLRIDHPDGLWSPSTYFARLQRVVFLEGARRAVASRALPNAEARAFEIALRRSFDRALTFMDGDGRPRPLPLYLAAEKILSRGEELPRGWAVHGTSGYDFTTVAAGVFVDASAERAMTAIYRRFTGQREGFARLIYEKKKLILRVSLASELNVLASALNRLSERDRRTRDFTLGTLTDALREVIACFPVYRTYIDEQTTAVSARDRKVVNTAVRLAQRYNPTTDASVYDFLRAILTLDIPSSVPAAHRDEYRNFVMKLQQLTAPVMAKGVEDTAFYVYNRLVSLNEVGGEPERFGIPVSELHRANEERQRRWPASMLATSTHDTKRSEDVRARVSVLSELTAVWEAVVEKIRDATSAWKTDLDGLFAPEDNEEYLLYQTLVGTWPAYPELVQSAPEGYADRIVAYMQKATKEAKVNTSWVNAAPEYDAAVERFVRRILGEQSFLDAFLPLARVVAFHGMWGALSQVLLKLTSPGVPDVYQGTEFWDDSLVDPDNRRRVDYALRKKLLDELTARRGEGAALCRELVTRASDGRIKLFVTATALSARRRLPAVFGVASRYVPLDAEGSARDHVIAFARRAEGEEILVVAPRLSAKLAGGNLEAPVGAAWEGTALVVPEAGAVYEDLFTGQRLTPAAGAQLPLAEILAHFPVALLARARA
jgi:(1->4)-alpha-D-glucan 1-alpha-D-glucosylmutase